MEKVKFRYNSPGEKGTDLHLAITRNSFYNYLIIGNFVAANGIS